MSYNHELLDSKWQKSWESEQIFKAETQSTRPKYYALDMFPYPSGAGLHVGHMASYMPTEIISRYKRTLGFNVLHPMGYDAFGLPAEQFAIQTGIHPKITTDKSIETFRSQLKAYGFSFDWSREISTCDPSYYKWTQFIFTKLWEKGLAYQKEVPVNWCPALRTVLANEEVVDGRSERGGHPVIRLPMKQWMLKITDYAEELLKDLETVNWPERTKEGQRNWIGKSEGAEISFSVKNSSQELKVFTTRPDTLFGVTFMVVAPEHPLVSQVINSNSKVKAYFEAAQSKSEVDRKAQTEKTGVDSGLVAIHPLNQKEIPIWIADYVLMDYGTGAIMAVPGHDERDFEFATAFNIEIARVLEGGDLPFTGDGNLVNSDFLNGLDKAQAQQKMLAHLEAKNLGQRLVQYKLRDWLFSRQRYWGEPFPMVRMSDQKLKSLSVNELPVLLPDVADYQPTEKGEPPLARVPEFVNYKSPTGEIGVRETDTMPGSAGSSWYFLRFTDPHNSVNPFDHEAQKYWMPVDLYVGGPEHTVGHLLYARFWQKVLFDAGLVSHREPFLKLAHQGMILGSDNEKMSKSKGNTVPADSVSKKYGADAARVYFCFMGPLDKDKAWSDNGIEGVKRFLDRTWRLCVNDEGALIATDSPIPPDLLRLMHKTIKKVSEDIENMSFNTAISAMMILVNELYRLNIRPQSVLKVLTQLLMPFAPHIAEELWAKMKGEGFVSLAPWPKYDKSLIIDETIVLGVQVNGKMRGTIELSPTADEATAVAEALKVSAISSALGPNAPKKIIYKAGKILNLIA